MRHCQSDESGAAAPELQSHSSRVSTSTFFFQAEDGIRHATVTGVQTCALPIFRCADVREEHAVTEAVERHPQRREPLGGGAVDGGDAEVFGKAVLRGEPKALSPQLVVIRQVGPAFAGASGGDVVRKQAGEPETVIAEMRTQQKGPFS